MVLRTPPLRITQANDRPLRADGDFVLYWMVAARRTHHNFALERACEHAQELGKPLLILEPLRCGYRWASDRIHAFVLEGMADNRAACQAAEVAYYPYVEDAEGAGDGLLEALAERAAVVVTDDWPCFFVPRMVAAAAARLTVAVETVDGNGLLPMRAAPKAFTRAFDFRRFLQKNLAPHLEALPTADPLAGLGDLPRATIPRAVTDRWPMAPTALLRAEIAALAALPIDHDVAPSKVLQGGSEAGAARLAEFLEHDLPRYADGRNHPDDAAQSNLSPWLHFGHVGTHQVLEALAEREDWSPADAGGRTDGKSEGWWNLSPASESFLDELVTWREVGFNMCHHRPDDYTRYESLPAWARASLEQHASDERDALYTVDQLAEAETDDEIWNAAQNQLRSEGRMHNYLRMLWGKKILSWTPDPETALACLIELNNRFALDGRDPNSYSGIFWCLGRYDRAWGPERPVFGKIRYMTSDSTRRKLRLKGYLARYNGT